MTRKGSRLRQSIAKTCRRVAGAPILLAGAWGMVRLSWRAYRFGFAGMIAVEIVQGLTPLGMAWLTKSLFDLLGQSITGREAMTPPPGLLALLAIQAMLALIMQVSAPVSAYLAAELGRRTTLDVQVAVYRKLTDLVGLAQFEQPQFQDTIRVATQGVQHTPVQALRTLLLLARNGATLVAFLAILVPFSLPLAGAIAATSLPQLFIQLRLGRQRFGLLVGNSPQERRAAYFGTVLSSAIFAKEVRLFGLAGYFLKAFRRVSLEVHQATRRQQRRELAWEAALAIFGALVSAGAFALVALQAYVGRATLGDLALYTSAVASVQSALLGLLGALSSLSEGGHYIAHLSRLLGLPQLLPVPEPARPVPPLARAIELRDVSFRYGEQHPWVLRHANLTLPAGQSVALVGLNGTGKTTLVKLLTRMYDPTEGQILWDGIDLRAFDPGELRRRCTAAFQDFAKYDLSAYDNIALGDVEGLGDAERVRGAARTADIHETIALLPQGYQTILSRQLGAADSGVDLSGGEWQRIALARANMRAPDLLILDEPTASLDALAERELHRRFANLAAGQTTLMISHRFGTVRLADIVAVLDGGRIVECGSHDDLMRLGGRYATFYSAQASQYALPPAGRANGFAAGSGGMRRHGEPSRPEMQ